MKKEKMTLKVASGSSVASVSGSIVKAIIEDDKKVEIISIGAGAVNQAVKSIATAQGILATKGIFISTVLGFTDVDINNEKRTAIKFIILVEN